MTEGENAKEIVQAILMDLTDRRGLRQAWDSIDEDNQAKIVETWEFITLRALDAHICRHDREEEEEEEEEEQR